MSKYIGTCPNCKTLTSIEFSKFIDEKLVEIDGYCPMCDDYMTFYKVPAFETFSPDPCDDFMK